MFVGNNKQHKLREALRKFHINYRMEDIKLKIYRKLLNCSIGKAFVILNKW